MEELLNDLKAKKEIAEKSQKVARADMDAMWAAEKRVHDAIQKKLREEYGDLFEDIRVVFYPRRNG